MTIPLKEKLMDHPSISLSASAKAIGSLNTLTVMPDGTLAAEYACSGDSPQPSNPAVDQPRH